MSYPSVTATLERQGTTVDAATNEQLETALLQAFATDLPLGMGFLSTLAQDVRSQNTRQLHIEDPSSPLGKQLIRLVGSDVARNLLQRYLNVGLGLYNCCCVVAAPSPNQLDMTAAEQIKLQNGDLAYADC